MNTSIDRLTASLCRDNGAYGRGLTHACGSMPAPAGMVRVSRYQTDTSFSLQTETPEGIPVRVLLPGKKAVVFKNGGKISL